MRAGVRRQDIAVASVFSTQSTTYLTEKTVAQVRSGVTRATADFNIVPNGSRAIFTLGAVVSFTWNQHTNMAGGLTPETQSLAEIELMPGAVGRLAFAEFESPDFTLHPGEYIPEVPSRTGTPSVQRVNTLSMAIAVPSGAMPRGGWPLAIYGHGTGRSNRDIFRVSSVLAARGFAVVAMTMAGTGFGPLTTATIKQTDGREVTFRVRGRGVDQNGDGRIDVREGDHATPPRTLQLNANAPIQNIADLTQLLRVLRTGVDVDGDGKTDLNPDRIYYFGHSHGGMYGMGFFALNPEVRAAVFAAPGAPLFRNRLLGPAARADVGVRLAARTPSLLNSERGLTSIGGVAVQPPFFNENIPLRDEPAVVNTIPGAPRIQQFMDRSEWIGEVGNPMNWAVLLRRRRVAGIPPRPFFVQFAASDQASPNPNTTNVLRAGGLDDRTSYFKYDTWWKANQTAPRNAHVYMLLFVPELIPVVRAAQSQIADFFASDGKILAAPEELREFWQVPIVDPLPERLNYIK